MNQNAPGAAPRALPVDDSVTGTDTLRSIDQVHRLLGYTPDFTRRELF
jgi:hypothetical protein